MGTDQQRDIRDEYGVFRRESRQQVMVSDTIPINRRAGGLTAHFVEVVGNDFEADGARFSDNDSGPNEFTVVRNPGFPG
jgi:hypothetical protein